MHHKTSETWSALSFFFLQRSYRLTCRILCCSKHNHTNNLFTIIICLLLKMALQTDLIKSFRELSLHQTSPLEPDLINALESLSINQEIAPIDLTPVQERALTARTPEIVPFPQHLFPQLQPLTRHWNNKTPLGMEALPRNNEYFYNPNRPFESLPRYGTSNPLPPRPPQQAAFGNVLVPTRYYEEQSPFYADNLGSDPFANEPEQIKFGPLKVLVLAFLAIFFRFVGSPVTITVRVVIPSLSTIIQLFLLWALVKPFKLLCRVVRSVEWEAFVVMALAAQIVKLLPGLGGAAVETGEIPEEPVWKLLMGGGHAIGNGPVYVGHS